MARKTETFLEKRAQLLATQNKHLEAEHALRLARLQGQTHEDIAATFLANEPRPDVRCSFRYYSTVGAFEKGSRCGFTPAQLSSCTVKASASAERPSPIAG